MVHVPPDSGGESADGPRGADGQLLAVAPLAAAVAAFGWTAGFAGLAAAGTVTAVLVFCLLRDAPGASTLLERLTRRAPGHDDAASAPPSAGAEPNGPGEGPVSLVTDALPVIGPNSSGIFPAISSLLKRPGVRLAFWVHFTTPFTLHSFMLLWGTPFITGGLGYSFGYNQAEDRRHSLSAAELIRMFVDVISKNGNLLINVGPRADGSLPELQREAMRGLGAWLEVNGHATYGTRPWIRCSEETGVPRSYTASQGRVHMHVMDPSIGSVELPAELSHPAEARWADQSPAEIADGVVTIPDVLRTEPVAVLSVRPHP